MRTKQILLLAGFLFTIMAFSCIKDTSQPLGDAGKTILKFNDGPQKSLFFSPFTDIKKINVFNFRRDPNSTAELTKPASVVLKLDPTVITKFNTDHNENFELLPPSFYTFDNDPGITINGDQFTFNFLSGEFAKNLNVKVDGTQWTDLSKKYALAFVVSNTDGYQLATSKDTMITFFSIKNKWDGVYEVSGTMTDVVNSALTHINGLLSAGGFDPLQIELRTIAPTKCAVYVGVAGNTAYNNYSAPIANGSSYSQYGSFSVIVEFDPQNDHVIAVTNYYGQPAANTRYGQLDPTGINTYDPVTKTISIKYNMCQPSVVPASPSIRTTWDETWKFKKDRE